VPFLDMAYLVKTRRSIRRFKPTRVSREIIDTILDEAKWAPSAHNAQPWRLIVIEDDGVKVKLAEAMGKAWLSDLLKDGLPRERAEEIIKQESWERITKSPVVIIVCLTMKEMHKYPDRRRRRAEYFMGVQSVAAYIQTLLLLAHYHGIGACWICAPLFCQNSVRKVLNLPREMDPQAMIIMGYADEQPNPPSRKGLEEIRAFNTWDKRDV